jgi:hypothetical protein
MTRRCRRCGVDREVNESRARRGEDQGLCRDCITVERDVAALDDWHGTAKGYKRHWRAGELACEPCLKAHNEACTAAHRRAGIGPVRYAPCGTPSGYKRHRRHDEEPCEPCRVARRIDDAQRYRKQKEQAA